MGINYLAIVCAGIASMLIGTCWYGLLFRKAYIRAMGWDNKTDKERRHMQRGMMWSYLWQFIASILMFYVLARFINATGETTTAGGMVVAFWAWLGFIVPLKFGDTLWGGKRSLFWLGISSSFIILLAGAAIIGAWR